MRVRTGHAIVASSALVSLALQCGSGGRSGFHHSGCAGSGLTLHPA
jgi:hypothetical protein